MRRITYALFFLLQGLVAITLLGCKKEEPKKIDENVQFINDIDVYQIATKTH